MSERPTSSLEAEEPQEIVAPDLDVEAIMQEIRARLRERRVLAKAQGLDFEAFADGLYPLPPDAILSREVHEAVRYLGLEYDKAHVELALTGTRVPLIGGWLQRVRAALHGLIVFYVNRLAARQVRVNEQTARALVGLVRDLEAEVRDLRSHLADVEAAMQSALHKSSSGKAPAQVEKADPQAGAPGESVERR